MDSALRRPGFNSSSDFIFKLVVLAVLGLSASESQVRASNLYKRDNTNSLNSVSSWATTSGGGTSPSSINSTDIGVFDNALSAANALKLSLDGNLSIGSLQFNGNLNGPITVSGSSTLTLNNAAGIDMSSANHDVTVECAIAFGIDQTWTVAGGQTFTVNGIVSGPGQLTKTGPGNLVLNRNNTFSGGTLITGGRVIVGNTNAFGPNSTDVSAITVSDAGTLDLNGVTVGAHSFAYGLTLGGSGFNGQGALINSGGDGGRNGLICLPNLSLFDDAAIGGSGNIYIVSHSGASYVPTSLEMNGRKLTVQMSSSATRLLLCKTTVTGGGVIHVESGMLGAYAADIVADETAFSFGANGRFMTAGGTYGASMGSLIGVTGSIVNIPSSFTLIVGGDNTSPGAFAGVLQGGGDIVKVGTGTLTLTGANTFSGVTTVNGGVLAVQTGSFPTNNALTVNDGGTFETIIAGTNQIAPSVLNVGSSSGAALGFVNVTNASAAPLKPGTLNIKGTLTINISGAAPAIGTYPLIANYTGGAVKLGTLPPMVTAHLITNNNRISLVVDSIADFSFAVIADPHVHSYWEGNARRLNAAVNWINENAAARKIKMVFLLGDICFEGSDQGRFVVAKVILDQLKVPYVPLLGDNDEQFPYPQGEFYWDNLFHAQFQTLSNAFPNFKKDEDYIYDTDDQRYVKLQNFSFDYGPLHFICLDWNGRTNVDNNIGQLNTWNGIGTVPFLSNDLATCQKPLDENVVVLQHIPLEDIADGGAQGFSL